MDLEIKTSEKPKGPSFRFFKKTSRPNQTLVASYHPPWSLTWGWALYFEPKGMFWFKIFRNPVKGKSGWVHLSLLKVCHFSLSWQQLMPKTQGPVCTRCTNRLDSTGFYCGVKSCVKKYPSEQRVAIAAWRRERERS
jgi:hypothetical protein